MIAYLVPVLGWLYVYLFQRRNPLALFHLRQSIGLGLFLLLALVAWAVVAWLLSWIPLLATLAVALFGLVILAIIYGVIAWIIGIMNASSGQQIPLPGIGNRADRLPIK